MHVINPVLVCREDMMQAGRPIYALVYSVNVRMLCLSMFSLYAVDSNSCTVITHMSEIHLVQCLPICYPGSVLTNILPWFSTCQYVTLVQCLPIYYPGSVLANILPWFSACQYITLVQYLPIYYPGSVLANILSWFGACQYISLVQYLPIYYHDT